MSKYTPVQSKTEKELKKLAIDIYDNKVYTNFMIPERERHHTKTVFMPLLFSGPHTPYSGNDSDIGVAKQRVNRIWEVLEEDEEIRSYEEDFIPSIGMIYEYYANENGGHNTMPRSLNGMPIFNSCRFLNLEDTDKIRDYFEQYVKIRKEADNF